MQRYVEINSRLERVLAVVKLRASSHSNELKLYSIDADGIHINEALPQYDGLLGGRPVLSNSSLPSQLQV